MRLARSPLGSADTKLNVTYENVRGPSDGIKREANNIFDEYSWEDELRPRTFRRCGKLAFASRCRTGLSPRRFALSTCAKWPRCVRPSTRVAVLQDWMKGRRGEVDDINGLVARKQRPLGRDAPINQRLVEIAMRIENGGLTAAPANADPLRSLLQT